MLEVDFLPEKLPKKPRVKKPPKSLEERRAFKDRQHRLESEGYVLKYKDVIEYLCHHHTFEAVKFRQILQPGYFKCPLCGKRSQQFVDVIREDGKKLSVGFSCLRQVGLNFNKSSVEFESQPGEEFVCCNEKEFQGLIRKAEKDLKVGANITMMKRAKKTLTNEDLDMLLEDL